MESALPSQDAPSWALAEYWVLAASAARSLMASLVPVGESEGRLMLRPVDIFSWLLASRLIPSCRAASEVATDWRWVILAVVIGASAQA